MRYHDHLWVLLLATIILAASSVAESFQWELLQKREEVSRAIGKKKLELVEEFGATVEIYRITQLTVLPNFGEKTIHRLSKILGSRFGYESHQQICYQERAC